MKNCSKVKRKNKLTEWLPLIFVFLSIFSFSWSAGKSSFNAAPQQTTITNSRTTHFAKTIAFKSALQHARFKPSGKLFPADLKFCLVERHTQLLKQLELTCSLRSSRPEIAWLLHFNIISQSTCGEAFAAIG